MPLTPDQWIGIGSTALNTVSGLLTNQANTDYQNQYNQDMRDWQLKMWNMNNEYNSPLNQRKRMEAAGLAPQLMYGQGTTGNSPSPPSMPQGSKAPQVSPLESANIGLMLAQMKNIEADTANKQATNPLLGAKLDTEVSKNKLMGQDFLNKVIDAKLKNQTYDNNAQANPIKLALLKQSLSSEQLKFKFDKDTYDDRKKLISAQATINESFARISDQRAKLLIQQMQAELFKTIQEGKNDFVQRVLMNYEVKLNKLGLQKNDNYWYRNAVQSLQDLLDWINDK